MAYLTEERSCMLELVAGWMGGGELDEDTLVMIVV